MPKHNFRYSEVPAFEYLSNDFDIDRGLFWVNTNDPVLCIALYPEIQDNAQDVRKWLLVARYSAQHLSIITQLIGELGAEDA